MSRYLQSVKDKEKQALIICESENKRLNHIIQGQRLLLRTPIQTSKAHVSRNVNVEMKHEVVPFLFEPPVLTKDEIITFLKVSNFNITWGNGQGSVNHGLILDYVQPVLRLIEELPNVYFVYSLLDNWSFQNQSAPRQDSTQLFSISVITKDSYYILEVGQEHRNTHTPSTWGPWSDRNIGRSIVYQNGARYQLKKELDIGLVNWVHIQEFIKATNHSVGNCDIHIGLLKNMLQRTNEGTKQKRKSYYKKVNKYNKYKKVNKYKKSKQI
jgi:hypothetical protein